jgi:hypothetical protein
LQFFRRTSPEEKEAEVRIEPQPEPEPELTIDTSDIEAIAWL